MGKISRVCILTLICVMLTFGFSSSAVCEEETYGITDVSTNYDINSIWVKFNWRATKSDRESVAASLGGSYKDNNQDGKDDRFDKIGNGNWALIDFPPSKSGYDYASYSKSALRYNLYVRRVEFNYKVQSCAIPNDTLFPQQWGLHNTGQSGGTLDADVDAPQAWNTTTGSEQILVGVIDSGIDYHHPDLIDNMWTNPNEIPNGQDDDGNGYIDDIHGIDAITGEGDPMDDYGHGTIVAGIIGAKGNNLMGTAGVCWDVKLVALKFLDNRNIGFDAHAVECINYALELRENGYNLRVLNNSWGQLTPSNFSQVISDAISSTNKAGMVFVAATGNNGRDIDGSPFYPASYGFPNIISVAATDRDDNLSGFSNWGELSADIGAPGTEIFSTTMDGGYSAFSGTSMAAPFVSGAVALMLTVDNTLTVAEIKDYLLSYGDPVSALTAKCVSGKRLNIKRSLDQLGAAQEPWFEAVYEGNPGPQSYIVKNDLETHGIHFIFDESLGSWIHRPNSGCPGTQRDNPTFLKVRVIANGHHFVSGQMKGSWDTVWHDLSQAHIDVANNGDWVIMNTDYYENSNCRHTTVPRFPPGTQGYFKFRLTTDNGREYYRKINFLRL